ncbi:MAG: hypothetical protein M1434_07190 [Chloroflexi bacterium]|nr:hypothetical protein [Chloroflexota bacterium]MCL5274516.1 hypothetical protein [Chloroflexota bacterium]
MNLSTDDAQLFFKLFFALLAYTSRQRNLVPEAITADDIRRLDTQRTAVIRDQLYADPEVLTRFLDENPDGLATEELNIVANWQHRVSGKFYLLRYLKKYTVFTPAEGPAHIYGVLGLFDPIEVVMQGQPLPIYLETTLLPFKAQIIYDGIVRPYSVLFGKGIRTDLDAQYNRLKRTEGIIEQLASSEGVPQAHTSLKARASKPAPDWRPALDEIVTQVDKMRPTDTPMQSAALGLLRAAAHLTQAGFAEPDMLRANLKQVRRALTRLETMLFEEEWE